MRRNGRRGRIPRPLANGCVVRRAYNYGNVPYPGGGVDGGLQVGITPSAVLDYSSYAAVWKRFRVLTATVHFVQTGQNDTTPCFPTLYVYHDVVSSGAPATLLDALVQKGRRVLAFGSNTMHKSFTFRPLPWTDGTFVNTIAKADDYWLPVGGAGPLTSAAVWMQAYNSGLQTPGLTIFVELTLHFDSPQ